MGSFMRLIKTEPKYASAYDWNNCRSNCNNYNVFNILHKVLDSYNMLFCGKNDGVLKL